MLKNFAKGSVAIAILLVLGALLFVEPTVIDAYFLANESFPSENAYIQQDGDGKTRPRTVQPDNNEANEVKEAENSADPNVVAVEAASELGKFQATCYCLRGKTALGTAVRRGIVAADPRVIPLGSRISISAGSYSGTYRVEDTGGVIRGRILDIWVPSCAEAIRFGRRTIGVSVIGGGKKSEKTKKSEKPAKKTKQSTEKTDKPKSSDTPEKPKS